MWSFERKKQQMVSRDLALPGRAEPMPVRTPHAVLGVGLNPPYPADCQPILFGMGCFWGLSGCFGLCPVYI